MNVDDFNPVLLTFLMLLFVLWACIAISAFMHLSIGVLQIPRRRWWWWLVLGLASAFWFITAPVAAILNYRDETRALRSSDPPNH